MEAMLGPLTWQQMPADFRMGFRLMRSPGLGWLMISVANIFIKKMLPYMVYRGISPEAQAYYASAYPNIASRKSVRQWPREIPINGKPADNTAVIKAYGEWLTRTQLPNILFHGSPGIIIRTQELAWCRENLANLHIVDIGDGLHFIQEDNPDLIGAELSKWHAAL